MAGTEEKGLRVFVADAEDFYVWSIAKDKEDALKRIQANFRFHKGNREEAFLKRVSEILEDWGPCHPCERVILW